MQWKTPSRRQEGVHERGVCLLIAGISLRTYHYPGRGEMARLKSGTFAPMHCMHSVRGVDVGSIVTTICEMERMWVSMMP